ncbi:Grx4 family monothiol glutaredoxin [Benzoatithermus flavus]|uniref:Glutaredoxin n=1 Tax=Benzoatithermus flavus TaxID=3108223 RepID=A0ABU8XPK2_9PROT
MSTINERIRQQIEGDDVVLYMKGTPVFPMCGFSAAVVQVLNQVGVPFQSYNVLDDMELRQGLKEFSNWPTFPQLYVKGELVGGCDIVREMYESGELQQLLAEKGITHKA